MSSGSGIAEEEELYDEFGNYIGPALDSDEDDDDSASVEEGGANEDDDVSEVSVGDRMDTDDVHGTDAAAAETADPMQAIVLHEDKEHYASAAQVYGDDVRTAVVDEDALRDVDTAIVVDKVATQSLYGDAAAAEHFPIQSENDWQYTDDYLGVHLANETTRNRRGVALVGDFHHGKTSLVDLLLQSGALQEHSPSSSEPQSKKKSIRRITDTLQMEQAREMSIVSTPVTTLLPDTRGKSYCITMLDCPGHIQFHEESVASLRAVDGAVLCVDAVEGPMIHTEALIKQIVSEGLPVVLVITKMDRLIVELQLPPRDAYYKLLHTIERLNQMFHQASNGRYPPLAPQRGNVAFASAEHGWLFTLESFAAVYLEHFDTLGTTDPAAALTVPELALRLWGDAYLDPATGLFHASPRDGTTPNVPRTFCALVLEPIYKMYTACLGESPNEVNNLLRSLGVLVSKPELRQDARALLKTAMSRFLYSARAGWVDMVVQHIPCPSVAAPAKVARTYTGPSTTTSSAVGQALTSCDSEGPLVLHAVKLYPVASNETDPDATSAVTTSFWTLCRVYSGMVRPATTVRVLGEAYQPGLDEEDMAMATIEAVAIPRIGPRLVTQVDRVGAGNWVLVRGVDATIGKTATIVGANAASNGALPDDESVHIFKPLTFPHVGGESVVKLSIEPLQPAELPKMVEGLRRVSKAYPMVRTKVEESGEHVLWGTGELYLDCVMHDLRRVYSDTEVKVADPVVSFRETVIDTSSVKCFAETANKRNKLTFLAEPMEAGLAEKLEWGKVHPDWDAKKRGRFFQKQYQWDLLTSRSIWAFGDSPTHGTNILLDDTLPGEVDKKLLNACKSSIVQGFQWATREGPLCEEPVRGTKLKILDVTLADKPIHRGGGQIIPTARRVVHASLLTATPRLMEPVYRLQIQCPQPIVENVQPLLRRRRGHIVQDRPIPGTTFYSLKGYLPVLDSFGFETDLRTFTQGQAMVYSVMDHWAVAPGDPLDKNIILHPLEPSPPPCLSRELLLKTRRRKGLSEDVSLAKFLDPGLRAQLVAAEHEAAAGGAVGESSMLLQ